MTSPLDERNPYGIRVVANRGPFQKDVAEAFDKGSRKAVEGINSLLEPQRRKGTGARSRSKNGAASRQQAK